MLSIFKHTYGQNIVTTPTRITPTSGIGVSNEFNLGAMRPIA